MIHGKTAEIIVYPDTDHVFFNDTRPEVHDAKAAPLLWDRPTSYFREQLS